MTAEDPVFMDHRIPTAHNSPSVVKKHGILGHLSKRRSAGRFYSHWFSYPIRTSAPAVELSHLFLAESVATTLSILNQI